jgi:small subunit ribosomal protein S13e
MLIKKVGNISSAFGIALIMTIKAVAVRKHLERNRKDKDSKFRLILIESRIHRLSRYYKTVGVLPPTWRYESATASTLVS